MKKGLAVGIIALLIILSISPLVIGHYQQNIVKSEMDILLEQLAFDCKDRIGGNAKFEYYKQRLLGEGNPVFDMVEDEYGTVGVDRYYKTCLNDPIEPLLVSGGLMNSSWPMKSHDTHHTGLSPISTIDVDGLEKWRFYSEDWIEDGAVIDSDGVIYFGSLGLNFYAVYPDGAEKWSFYIGDWTWCAPAISEDGTIYIGSDNCNLYAVNPDGTQKWRFDSGGSISSSPAIAEDGEIYFGTLGPGNIGKIYAINPDGTEKWHYDTDYWIESDPVIGDDGTIYIGSGDTYFYAINPNGTLRWRFKTGDEIHGHPSIADDGTIYISSFDDYLYAINPDGTEKWRSDIDYGLSNGVAIGEDGTIYVARLKMHALNPDDGSVIWSTNLGGDHWISESSPCVSADGTIYVGTHDSPYSSGGDIIAFNPDGSIKWRKEISVDSWVDSSPCIGPDGTVYIGSAYWGSRGFLHAFGPVDSNSPPNAPNIDGPRTIEPNKDYWYTFNAVDPDNNPVTFYIDWGDGDEGWYIEWGSGFNTWSQHSWSEKGDYTIRAKVKDVFGEESDWSYFEVAVPVNQQIQAPRSSFPLLQKILELFPNIFPFLKYIFYNIYP